MQFNSVEYLAFLAVVLVFYYAAARTALAQQLVVVLASAAFYAFWSPAFLVHFFAIVAGSYGVSRWAMTRERAEDRRRIVIGLIVVMLANLALWKYAALAVQTLNAGLGWLGVARPLDAPRLVLPLAISFYTFHIVSYVVDLYRGLPHSRPRNLLEFAFYVTMFPHQIAGPILRGHELFPQIDRKPLRAEALLGGAQTFLVGLFQKAVVADNLAIVADYGFARPGELTPAETYVALMAYTFQIFFDFAGYTRMGIGSARMLGYELPENFDNPYAAADISEFWRRWHMTLSRWIRDYIFVPLGGSRGSSLVTARNMLITMGLAGLWHGASWTFVAWGLYHGLAIVVHRGWRASRLWALVARTVPAVLHRVLGIAVTFHVVALGWVLFRAPDFEVALDLYGALTRITAARPALQVDEAFLLKTYGFTTLLLYGLGLLVLRLDALRWRLAARVEWRFAAWGLLVFCVVVLAPVHSDPFIYFQF